MQLTTLKQQELSQIEVGKVCITARIPSQPSLIIGQFLKRVEQACNRCSENIGSSPSTDLFPKMHPTWLLSCEKVARN